jgi:N-acetylglucosaminyl-diphospho-decaprenol L-rhamnosyltransferase
LKMPPEVTVVIVNYNSGGHLADCLSSIYTGLAGLRWEVVVVDNASGDGSEKAAENAIVPVTRSSGSETGVRLVRLLANTGFAAAANLGARTGKADRLLLINPDCLVATGFIDPLLRELDASPRCAAVAPCVINEDGSAQGNARGDPTIMTGFFGRTTLLSQLFPSTRLARRNVVLPAMPGNKAIPVDWVSGSCVLVRREAFDAVGGFDERYFLYWEDADLCRRLRNAGWSICLRRDARVVHVGGRSSRTAKSLAIRAFHRSAYLYYVTYVAPSPWSVRRWLAAALLSARCGIKLVEAQIR